MQDFAGVLNSWMERTGATPAEIAVAIQVSSNDVNRWLGGHGPRPAKYRIDLLVSFFEAKGVVPMVEELRALYGDENMPLVVQPGGAKAEVQPLAPAQIVEPPLAAGTPTVGLDRVILETTRRELREVLQQSRGDDPIRQRLEEIIKRLEGGTATPQAQVHWQEDLEIYLVPSDALNELDYLHKDENWAWAIIGVTAGAVLGIISNWVTSSASPTPSAAITLLLLVVATIAAVLWLRRIEGRIQERHPLSAKGKKESEGKKKDNEEENVKDQQKPLQL